MDLWAHADALRGKPAEVFRFLPGGGIIGRTSGPLSIGKESANEPLSTGIDGLGADGAARPGRL